MKKSDLTKFALCCVAGTGILINPVLTMASPNVDKLTSEMIAEVKDNFVETDSLLAKDIVLRAYCLGKSKEEVEKYVDFSDASNKGADNNGNFFEFEEEKTNYYQNDSVTEGWHFNGDNVLEYIAVNFNHASDSRNFNNLDLIKGVLGEYTETSNKKVGLANCYWDRLPTLDVTQTYNYRGSDESRDDGIVDLNITYAMKESDSEESTSKETTTQVNETEEEEKPLVEYKDATTARITQQALNDAGYNCGTPDGIAGAKTTEAINAYQTAKGITVNGKITDELLKSLGIKEKVQAAIEAEGKKNEYGSDYTYEQLARNPDTYVMKKMKFTGKVLQAETGNICYMRLAINSNYDTVLFVTYDKDVLDYRLLEDDIVTIYGASLGVYSYEAVSGATITLPWIEADMIELQ